MELLWLVGEDADGDIAAQLWLVGESLCSIGNRIPETLLLRADSDCSNTVQEGSSVQEAGSLVQPSPWSVGCMRGPCEEAAGLFILYVCVYVCM